MRMRAIEIYSKLDPLAVSICMKLVGSPIICLSSEGNPGQDGSVEILQSSKRPSFQELLTIWTNCVKYPKAMMKNHH